MFGKLVKMVPVLVVCLLVLSSCVANSQNASRAEQRNDVIEKAEAAQGK